jgi:hypothetical protein
MATTTEVGIKITVDGSEATKSVGSIKSQLKEATAELIAMREKFGDTSDEAVKAAKKVAGLKDSIGDAKAMADAFNPDAKFKAFSTALQGVAGGFSAIQGAMGLMGGESKEVEKLILKVNSAMALSQGVNSILEAKDGFKNLKTVAIDAFKGIKTAIGSTGIGLLVVALGTIYAYWDDIKAAVGGVGAEQKKINSASAENLKTQQKKLDAIGSQDNILKLQGKSERDILKIKIAQTDETITAAEANLQNLKTTKIEQVKIAERNKEILKGLLNLLSLPITAVLAAVDNVRSALGQTSTLLDDYKEGLANLVFNPESVAKEADLAIEQADKGLTDLKNQRAGFQLSIQGIDKAASDKKNADNETEKNKELELNKSYANDLKVLKEENFLNEITDDNKRAKEKLRIDYENQQNAIKQKGYSKEQEALLLIELDKKFALDKSALDAAQKKKEEDDAKAKLENEIAFEEETFRIKNDLRISKIKDEGDKARELEALKYQAETDAALERLNNKEITQAEYDARAEALKLQHESRITDIEKSEADKKVAIAKAEKEAKEKIYMDIADSLGRLSDVVGKETEAGKAFAIAQLVMVQGMAVAKQVASMRTAIMGALATPQAIASGGLSAIPTIAYTTLVGGSSIASSIAAVVRGIKQIKSAGGKGGGGGGGGGDSAPMGAPAPPPPLPPQLATQTINGAQINQLASATARAYVVESDVSGNQERINRLNRASRIN